MARIAVLTMIATILNGCVLLIVFPYKPPPTPVKTYTSTVTPTITPMATIAATLTQEPTPTQEINWLDPTGTPSTPTPIRQYVNDNPYTVNMRACADTACTAFDLPPDARVGWLADVIADDGRLWYGVCLVANDGSCSGSYYVAAWVVELYRG